MRSLFARLKRSVEAWHFLIFVSCPVLKTLGCSLPRRRGEFSTPPRREVTRIEAFGFAARHWLQRLDRLDEICRASIQLSARCLRVRAAARVALGAQVFPTQLANNFRGGRLNKLPSGAV